MRLVLAAAAALAAVSSVPPAVAAVAPVRWCGNDLAQADRLRDRAGGPQVHVVYALPADGEDRFAALASDLATDVAAIDAWWRREDAERAPRFDLFDFPGCESRFGLLDLTYARLAQPAAMFLPLGDRFERLARALGSAPFELDDLDKKYLVFFDGPVEEDEVCGTAAGSPTLGGPFSYAIVYLRSTCGASIGGGRGNAFVAAHELAHTLGAVPRGAPNTCPGDEGHVCDSSVDLIWPYYSIDTIDQAILDVNRDDYYGHGGAWFDLRTSRWLMNPLVQLPLSIRVVGSGIVGSEPDGQGCESACVTEWDRGTSVQLAADPAPGYRFVGWGAACAAEREASCLLELGGPTEVVASFGRIAALTVAISGRGTVTAAGLRCARTCRSERLEGETLTLRARAARGWRFARWAGGCRGSRPSCRIRLAGAGRVAAAFARR